MLWLHHFLLCGLYSLCHKGMLSNNICSVEDLSCNSFLWDKNGQLLLFSFTAPAACKNILECLANWLIKYEGVQCITIFHRLHLALCFGCLILVTETVKRTDNGVQLSKSVVWHNENWKWCCCVTQWKWEMMTYKPELFSVQSLDWDSSTGWSSVLLLS